MALRSPRYFMALLCILVLGAVTAWLLTAPKTLSPEEVAALPHGNKTNGEQVFWAAGCASCHAGPKAKGKEKLLLGGGIELPSPFGTFVAPNISPDQKEGIGSWSLANFANAMKHGVSPEGQHYFPAFPYTSYARMTDQDIADLWSYLQSLEPVSKASLNHNISFPFNVRRSVGAWKLLFFDNTPIHISSAETDQIKRGRYIVEALAHCGECHTPRNALGGSNNRQWLAGGVSPEGEGKIPNITPHPDGIGGWSEKDIIYSLETGFTPEFDSFGSSMVSVQQNMAKLTAADRAAIAAYLKAIPALASNK